MNESTLKYLQTFHAHLTMKNYSKQTIASYESVLKKFLEAHKISPVNVTADIITSYISKMGSASAMAQARGALMNFYTHVVGQPNKFDRIPYPKKDKKIPQVLAAEVVVKRLRAISNLKHHTMCALLYNSGLRASELLDLKVEHIDFHRKVLHVHGGKGNKDRVVPISEDMLSLLDRFISEYKPSTYLISGQTEPRYSYTSLRNVVQNHMKCSPHLLRHCYATHLREKGMDLAMISKLLGHKDMRTSLIYDHMAIDHNPMTLAI